MYLFCVPCVFFVPTNKSVSRSLLKAQSAAVGARHLYHTGVLLPQPALLLQQHLANRWNCRRRRWHCWRHRCRRCRRCHRCRWRHGRCGRHGRSARVSGNGDGGKGEARHGPGLRVGGRGAMRRDEGGGPEGAASFLRAVAVALQIAVVLAPLSQHHLR